MKAILSTLSAATCLVLSAEAMKEVRPGVFSIPLEKVYKPVNRHQNNLEQGHPVVGDWEEAEMWNMEVKEPVMNLDNYMYAIDCSIGGNNSTLTPHATYTNQFKCVFDTTTSVSSTFSTSFTDYSTVQYDPHYSPTEGGLQDPMTFDSLGLSFTGNQYTDQWCLGGGDVHITVCLDDHPFVLTTKENYPNNSSGRAQWSPPLKQFNDVTAIIGLGSQPLDPNTNWSFVDEAFQQGLIASNTYTFQGVYEDPEYAHVTIGGYNYQDMSSDIEWFNMTYTVGWVVNITNMTIDGDINLLAAPTPAAADDHYLGADEVAVITSYGHFNSGYPFIGVDANVGKLVEDDLTFFRPDISCQYDATLNPWSICYYAEACQADAMPGNLTFAFGTDATFNLPVSSLQIDYTVNSQDYCGIGIQNMKNMKYVWDIATERHFYFGDIFFKQFVGVFDQGNNLLGLAKSNLASTSVEFACAGSACAEPSPAPPTPEPPAPTPDPEPTPDPPTPDPPVPVPVDPVDPEDGGDDNWMWIWIAIALAILFLIALFLACYYRHQSKKKDKWAAVMYANTPGNDGDLIEKDVESYAGKGDLTKNQFQDHDELMQGARDIVEDEPIPSPYGLQ